MEGTPTAAVWTVRLRGLGCCVGLCRLTLVWSLCRSLSRGEHEAVTEEIEARPAKHLAFHHLEAVDVPTLRRAMEIAWRKRAPKRLISALG